MKCGGSDVSVRIKYVNVTVYIKANQQYLPVMLFIMLYKVVLSFEPRDEIVLCGHSNESS